MKKNIRKITALILITIFLTALLGANTTLASTSVTITEGNNTPYRLLVTRNMKKITNPVTNTFTYSITPATTNPEGATGEPTSFEIEYNNVSPNENNVATSTGYVDFSGATYSKVGDYVYTVKETASSDATTFPIATTEYEIYVSVRYEVDADNKQTGNLVATLAAQGINTADRDTGKQDLVYPNDTNFTNIQISGEVLGNMADKDEYFKVLVSINGNTGDKYTITGQDATVTYNNTSITTSNTYTVGNTAQYIYLKHGQTITIGLTEDDLNQIKIGTKYQIVEQDATTYSTYINSSTTNSKDSGELTTVKEASSNKVNIVNEKVQATLTGIFLNIMPYCLLVIVAGALIIVMIKSKNKNKDN